MNNVLKFEKPRTRTKKCEGAGSSGFWLEETEFGTVPGDAPNWVSIHETVRRVIDLALKAKAERENGKI